MSELKTGVEHIEDLAGKARSALVWCVEKIGKTSNKQEGLNSEHSQKINEINRLISELAESIDPDCKDGTYAVLPVKQMEFTLADGRQFKVRRLL